jgi:excisionase family DNA binding protein
VVLLLTAEEVASLLRLNERTVRNMANRGELPGAVRLGREWRFKKADMEQLVGQQLPKVDDREMKQ